MSHSYLSSNLRIAAFKLNAYQRRQLEIIHEAYSIVKDIPSHRWGPKYYDLEFNTRSLFGHYAVAKNGGECITINRFLVLSAPLRAALNEFVVSELEVGGILEGLAEGSAPVQGDSFVPDYKLIAISLLEMIISEYPPIVPKKRIDRKSKAMASRIENLRIPYKD